MFDEYKDKIYEILKKINNDIFEIIFNKLTKREFIRILNYYGNKKYKFEYKNVLNLYFHINNHIYHKYSLSNNFLNIINNKEYDKINLNNGDIIIRNFKNILDINKYNIRFKLYKKKIIDNKIIDFNKLTYKNKYIISFLLFNNNNGKLLLNLGYINYPEISYEVNLEYISNNNEINDLILNHLLYECINIIKLIDNKDYIRIKENNEEINKLRDLINYK
jgi:hypothetical protein